jgi:hypothetical protein
LPGERLYKISHINKKNQPIGPELKAIINITNFKIFELMFFSVISL